MDHTPTLPQLPYQFKDLEPVISHDIMEVHYSKHHQTYVTNLVKALEEHDEATKKGDLDKMIALQPAIRFNGGGHINHSIFWTNLAPKGQGGAPSAQLLEAINRNFGSLDKFKEKFNAKTVAVQGSGWGWLGYDKAADSLTIATCVNQDPLQATTGLVPLLGVDVWEHAYYLQYKNLRAKYLESIWDIVNWKNISDRYQAAKS